MTTKRVTKSDVTASVNPMSILGRIRTIRSSFEHKTNELIVPVKDDTKLENSNSNHLSKNTFVKGESRFLVFLVAITFNV